MAIKLRQAQRYVCIHCGVRTVWWKSISRRKGCAHIFCETAQHFHPVRPAWWDRHLMYLSIAAEHEMPLDSTPYTQPQYTQLE